ncbi:MAG: DUF4038 domain-containing protein [Planctomycetes bacterium]|nr:DUF4038 domain-containing protein [Planctomycetota bacterium]
MIGRARWLLLLAVAITLPSRPLWAEPEAYRVWQKMEITLPAANAYENPYRDVTVWVDLTGPGFRKRCYGFWDGGNTFRVRVLAVAPGSWAWVSGSNQSDPGLNSKTGGFKAEAWSKQERVDNPCRRGVVRATANGHAFEYAEGTPFFLLGDTWWSVGTFRYPWHDDGTPRPMGPNAGFKDYVRFRKEQGFNCIALIAAFPNWANDGQSASLQTPDGTVLRSAWRQAGTDSAKDMQDEAGNRAFLFPGRVPGFETIFPDLDRINPAYFQNLDRKIDYLNAQGMIPFIEVARRDIGQAWKKYYEWPVSYTRYIQYIWSRYQANICFFSPIHFDYAGATVPAADWNVAANVVIEKYGPPPFGTLVSCNSNPSSLRDFGHTDKAKWLTFHQIGNGERTHNSFELLTEIFSASPAVPAVNGEPYYAGMEQASRGRDANGVGEEGRNLPSALYCRSAMYGSVLSGGLGGHIYGAGDWDGGLWGGNVEPVAKTHIWDVIQWESAAEMRHLASFVLSQGREYQKLVPHCELVRPNRSGPPKDFIGWAYCARTEDQRLFLLYFEKGCPRATVSGALSGRTYEAAWFNPRTGDWIKAGPLEANRAGVIPLPVFPGDGAKSTSDWAVKLALAASR